MNESQGMHWKDRLRQERIRRNWRQRDLAERLDTTILTIQRWERGSHQPGAYFRVKLCALFEKSPEELGFVQEDLEPSPAEETSVVTSSEASDEVQGGGYVQDVAGDMSAFAAHLVSERLLAGSTASAVLSQKGEKQQPAPPRLLHRRSVLVGLGGLGLGVLATGGAWFAMHASTSAHVASSRQPLAVQALVSQRLHHLLDSNSSNWVNKLAWSPDGRQLVAAGGSNVLEVWNLEQETIALTYPTLNSWVNDVSWARTNWIAAATADLHAGALQIWKFPEKTPVFTMRKAYALRSVGWSPDGNYMAVSGHVPEIEVWDPFTARQLSRYSDSKLGLLGISRVRWSPSGRFLACAADDATAHVWDAMTGEPRVIYHGHQSRVHDLAWSPDERYIVSCGSDKTCQVWDVASGRTRIVYRGHTAEVEGVDWSPHGGYIASASADRTAQVWRALTGQQIAIYGGHSSTVGTVLWSVDESVLAIGMEKEGIEIWRVPRL